MTKQNNSKTLTLKCNCGCNQYFEISQFDEDEFGEEEIFIAMINASGKDSLLTRIITAIKHIFGYQLITHDLLFCEKQLQQLKTFINNV